MIKYANEIIGELVLIGERQFEGEIKAKKIIEDFLRKEKIKFSVQRYVTQVPRYLDWRLRIDGKEVDSLPCGFKSGKIRNKNNMLSSLVSSQKNFYDANINFNPLCDFISRSNHYMAPALAINKKDTKKVLNADSVEGFINVEKVDHESANILVGNIDNPKNIIFSHYDSIGVGAVDNASGVAMSIEIIMQKPDTLKNTLFVIAGNEELSYDETVYWGRGYRVFQKKYLGILEKAKNIFILDCLGYSPLEITTDPNIIKLGFPVENMEFFVDKIKFITGNFEKSMPFYHAENDTIDNIKNIYLQECKDVLLRLVE